MPATWGLTDWQHICCLPGMVACAGLCIQRQVRLGVLPFCGQWVSGYAGGSMAVCRELPTSALPHSLFDL